MQVSKWGNSLATRIQVADARTFAIKKSPSARELLARLRKYRGRLPADFKFDRIEANERR